MKHPIDSWIDISITLANGLLVWPGDPEFNIQLISSIEKGDETNISALSLCAHSGTHVDAPLHYIANGDDVTKIPVDKLIGNARVISILHEEAITKDELLLHSIKKGDRLLFKTNNSNENWTDKPFRENFIALQPDAAELLAETEVALVGIDYISIAGYHYGTIVHQLLLQANICIVEGLLLNTIEPGNYEMICLPLKIAGADGSPARVLIRKYQ
ncbi:cyclase family protein [soil metagenome]